MSYTERTYTSWFERIKNALIGIVVGLVLVIVCIWLLAWNEGRSVQTYRALAEGTAQVVSVDSRAIDPFNDGNLVHISGAVAVQGEPEDGEYGIGAPNAVGLARNAEMYQWVEKSESQTEKKLGGGEETITTYSYVREWRDGLVDSSDFREPAGHQNPDWMPDNQTFAVDTASVGEFAVDGSALTDVGKRSALTLDDEQAGLIAEQIGGDRAVERTSRGVFLGDDSSTPQIGDMRIFFQRIDLAEASVVGRQSRDSLVPHRASNGEEIFLVAAGDVPADAMFKAAQDGNALITWLIRLGGLIGLFIGFALAFSIFGVIGDLVPFIGSIIGFGTGLVAFILALVVGPLVIALAWLAYRPLLSLGLIAGGVLIAAGIVFLRRKLQKTPA